MRFEFGVWDIITNARRSKTTLLPVLLLIAGAAVCAPAARAVAGAQPTPSLPAPQTTPTAKPSPSPSPAPIELGGLTVSGSLRLRFESWDWFETASAANDAGGRGNAGWRSAPHAPAAVDRQGLAPEGCSLKRRVTVEVPSAIGLAAGKSAKGADGSQSVSAAAPLSFLSR